MGNQQNAQPSPTTQTPTSSQESKPKPSAFDPAHPTGIAAVDTAGRGVCKAEPSHAGCFLDKDQREMLVIEYLHRLSSVQINCKNALTLLKVEELIKSPEQLPWYASILVSAVAAVLTDGLSLLASAGVSAAAGAIGKEAAAVGESALASVNLQKMRALIAIEAPTPAPSPSPAAVKAAVGKAMDLLKGAATPGLATAVTSDSEATTQKTEGQGYLEFLDREMDKKFDELALTPPATTTDAELLALFKSFDMAVHTTSFYETRFRAQLDRFVHSHASQIGRRVAWDERRGSARLELETRVAWLITKGAGKRLIYVDRAFHAASNQPNDVLRATAYDSGANQLSLQQEGTWTTPSGQETRRESPIGPDLMLNYVEPEFVEVALETQEHVWLAPPETFMLDYSYAPPRMVKVAS